jgi:hypothetical protein
MAEMVKKSTVALTALPGAANERTNAICGAAMAPQPSIPSIR